MCGVNPLMASFPNPQMMRTAIAGTLPKILTIDQEEVERAVSFAVPGADAADTADPLSKLPEPLAVFADQEDNGKAAFAFLERYITLFDTDRAAVSNAYAASGLLTVTVTRDDNADRRSAGGGNRLHTNGSFAEFARLDRNHQKVKQADRWLNLAKIGRGDIASTITALPRTTHEKDGIELDVSGVLGRLVVSVHGSFKETTQNNGKTTHFMRAFDRTFVLAVAEPGSPAAAAGFQVEITNDQLNVRYVSRAKLATKSKGKSSKSKGKGKGKIKAGNGAQAQQFQQHGQQQQQFPQQQQQFGAQQQQQQQQPSIPGLGTGVAVTEQAATIAMLANRTQMTQEICSQALEAAQGDSNQAFTMIEQYKQEQQQQQQQQQQ
jgi:nuclear RNA export factor